MKNVILCIVAGLFPSVAAACPPESLGFDCRQYYRAPVVVERIVEEPVITYRQRVERVIEEPQCYRRQAVVREEIRVKERNRLRFQSPLRREKVRVEKVQRFQSY